MRSNRPLLVAFAVIGVLVVCPIVWGSQFEHPPEVYAPEWATAFPYQRNIDWTFDTDPRGGPSATGAPGAHYEGYDDPVLKVSDFVTFDGVQWFEEVTVGTMVYTGVIGIDNTRGTSVLSGTATFHIDNWPDNTLKHIWEEIDAYGENTVVWQTLALPAGYAETDEWTDAPWQISTDPKLDRYNIWYEIMPNPPWEEKVFTFDVAEGGFAFIDRVHIATECIPEPSTFIVWSLLGALGIAAGWWRRKRA